MATNSRSRSNIILYLTASLVVGLATFVFLKSAGNPLGKHYFEGLLRIPWLV